MSLIIIFILPVLIKAQTTWSIYNTLNSGLPDDLVQTVTIDASDRKWVGTETGGLAVFDGAVWTVYNTLNSGLPLDSVRSIAIDASGRKWIGTYGGGVALFDGAAWTVYHTGNSGLPSNKVTCIAIDASDRKWIGTENGGLAVFNGSGWAVYNTGNSSIPSDQILSLAIDGSDSKWVGTWGSGLAVFDDLTWTTYNTLNSGLPNDEILCITIDSSNRKWIGTWGFGLVSFDDITWTVYSTAGSGLPHDEVRSVSLDGSGKKCIGTFGGGLALFDDVSWTVYNTGNSGLPNDQIRSVAVDGSGWKWVGTYGGGLAVLEETLYPETSYSELSMDFGFVSTGSDSARTNSLTNTGEANLIINMTSLTGTNPGDFWMAAGTYPDTLLPGFSRFLEIHFAPQSEGWKQAQLVIFSNAPSSPDTLYLTGEGDAPADVWDVYNTSNSGLPYNYVTQIRIDGSGRKWIGTQGGLALFDGTSWTVYNTGNSGLPGNDVRSIFIDGSNVKWIGTFGGGLASFDGTTWNVYNTGNSGIPTNDVHCVAVDGTNVKWMGTYGGGLASFDGTDWAVYNAANSGLPYNEVSAMAREPGTPVQWLGTYGGGLASWDGVQWQVYNTGNSGLPNNFINENGLQSVAPNTVWIGTGGGGLAVREFTSWTVYNMGNSGIPSDNVYGIAFDGLNNIWVGTNGGGLAVFDGFDVWTVYNTGNSSLPADHVYCVTVDSQGNKWIGTWGGGLAVLRAPAAPAVSFNPTSMDFGTVPAGNDSVRSLRITNTGSSDLNLFDVFKSGADTASFQILSGGGPGILAPSQYRDVEVLFAPVSQGPKVANLIVLSDAGTSPDTMAVTGLGGAQAVPVLSLSQTALSFGNVVVSSSVQRNVVVSNTGGASLSIFETFLAGQNFNEFTVTGGGPANLLPGTSKTVTLTLTPQNSGAKQAQLVILSNAATDPDTVVLSGQAGTPVPVLSANTLSFGQVRTGLNATRDIFLSNRGDLVLSVLNLSFIGANAVEFSITDAGSASIVPFDSTRIRVRFAPESPGAKQAILQITTNASGTPLAVNLAGEGGAPTQMFSTQTLDYGTVTVGETRLLDYSISNTETVNLTINALTLSGADAGSFQIVSGGEAGILLPSGSRTVTVRFLPDARGFRQAVIIVTHSAASSPDTVALSGSGIAPELELSAETVDFDTVAPGSNPQRLISVSNTGDAELSLYTPAIAGLNASEFSIVSGAAAGVLPVSSSREVNLQFTPAGFGVRLAFLVIASNAASSPDSVRLTGYSSLPSMAVQVASPVPAADLPVSVTLSASIPMSERTLYYKPSGRIDYESVALTQNGLLLEGVIPGSAVTLRGVDFYARLSNGQFVVTFPETDPQRSPAHLQVPVASYRPDLTLGEMTYRMVSVPLALELPGIFDVLGDDYGEYDRTQWRVCAYRENVADYYAEYPDLRETFIPGAAMWLIARSGRFFDVEDGISVNASAPYSVTLQPGWNQVADPFAFSVDWSSVVAEGDVEAPVYWNGTDYEYGVQVLDPWEGYFIQNRSTSAVSLLFVPEESAAGTPKRMAKSLREGEYRIQISADVPGFRLMDRNNFVGFLSGAAHGLDSLDFAEAPPIGDHLQLAILEKDGLFAGNFKTPGEKGYAWDLRISTNLKMDKQAHLCFSEQGSKSDSLKLYLLDRDFMCAMPVSGLEAHVDLKKDLQVRNLRLIIGTPEFAREAAGGIPIIPMDFAIEQNYPNPFNPSTAIAYQVGRKARVLLDVFDVLGRKVRTLLDGEQVTGRYVAHWDGNNDRGIPVPAGVYICRIRAEGFSAARKMILVR
ncbi:choice-of-anchor D domain-containing protein [bacterium]|nr:choice-of-anchor D domain-containing protein [bacterium]